MPPAVGVKPFKAGFRFARAVGADAPQANEALGGRDEPFSTR